MSFQDDGTWSHPLPKCLSPCIVPDVPMGRVANHTSYRNSVMHGEHISVQCTRNFELEGNVTQITCNNGTFDRMPRCEPGNFYSFLKNVWFLLNFHFPPQLVAKPYQVIFQPGQNINIFFSF